MSTTDPGVEDGIRRAADNVERDQKGEDGDMDADNSYLHPSRWWFASTACPLLAGTFGPLANGFSICALVYNWRVYIPDGGTEEHGEIIKDPAWLIAVNALSLVAALVGNASLLLNMARRLRFSIAQPITITGFLTAGVLLVCDMAAITSSSTYRITDPKAEDPAHHALTSAFYYAIIATVLYVIIGMLMCLTVYGANNGYYKKDFQLTPSQRTLMLQTMSFITYLLLGALVFSKIEGWKFLDAVYWADVTLLTVGLGDFTPATKVGKGLLFPFAIGGILIVGLVIGSIRTLVLERGKEKIAARITEKRRNTAISNVSVRHQTIKVSFFTKADFSTDPFQPLAERRREEFVVMRQVQAAAETERRYMALALSGGLALLLWFVGAAVFMIAEKNQEWTYFNALYFSFTSLLTIGYGDFQPLSNAGRSFYVIWSLLAVPSLTILISNMGDTIVKWVTELTDWLGAITVLPDEHGARATLKQMLRQFHPSTSFTGPGILGFAPSGTQPESLANHSDFETHLLARLAARLRCHVEDEDLAVSTEADNNCDPLERDIHFYQYVLSRECRTMQKDLSASPPKKYTWSDWEYFLKLMGNTSSSDDDVDDDSAVDSDARIPDALRVVPTDSSNTTAADLAKPEHSDPDLAHPHPPRQRTWKRRPKRRQTWTQDWSWLSSKSPLMSTKTESEWILERLSAALERELNWQRKRVVKKPPISYAELKQHFREVASGKAEGEEKGVQEQREVTE